MPDFGLGLRVQGYLGPVSPDNPILETESGWGFLTMFGYFWYFFTRVIFALIILGLKFAFH